MINLLPVAVTLFGLPVALAIANALLLMYSMRDRAKRYRTRTRDIAQRMQLQALYNSTAHAEREAA